MKRRSRFPIAAIVISMGIALVIAGCGGDGEEETTTTTTTEPATSTTTTSTTSVPSTTTTSSTASTTTTTTTTTTSTTTTTTTTTSTTTTTLPSFQGGTYNLHITALSQQPADCLMPQALLDVLVDLITGIYVPVYLPPPNAYPTDITIDLPEPIGTIVIEANYTGGQLVFTPVTLRGIDVGSYNIPGYNCVVGGTGSGGTTLLSRDRVVVNILITDMSATQSPNGSGPCNLSPSPNCTLTVTLEGTRVLLEEWEGY